MSKLQNDNQHLLDLLVDNELNELQRRELLARCEAEPDGWRACALAFIEAQAWSGALGRSRDVRLAATTSAVAGEQTPLVNEHLQPRHFQPRPPAASAAKLSRPARVWNVSLALGGLAMAASLLLAFGIGMWMNPASLRGLVSPPKPDFVIGSTNTERGKSPNSIGHVPVGRSPQTARLVVGGSAGSNEVRVPIMEGDDLDDDWWRRQPAAMPAEMRQALERLGHQVHERRQLVPFDLDDGRRIMVPVDQVDVEPAEGRLYQ